MLPNLNADFLFQCLNVLWQFESQLFELWRFLQMECTIRCIIYSSCGIMMLTAAWNSPTRFLLLQLKTWHLNCPSPPTVSNWTSWTNPFVFPIIRLLMILIKSISSNWTPLYSGYLCNTIVFSEVYSMPPNLSFSSNLLNVNTPFPLIQFQCLNIEWIYWQTYSLWAYTQV